MVPFFIVFDPHFIELDTPWGRFEGASANVSRLFAKTLTFVKCFTARKTIRDSAVWMRFVYYRSRYRWGRRNDGTLGRRGGGKSRGGGRRDEGLGEIPQGGDCHFGSRRQSAVGLAAHFNGRVVEGHGPPACEPKPVQIGK